MTSNRCCVPGCMSSYGNALEGTTWHILSKDEAVANGWIADIGNDLEMNKGVIVCSFHFKDQDFETSSSTSNKTLSADAVSTTSERKCDSLIEKANTEPDKNQSDEVERLSIAGNTCGESLDLPKCEKDNINKKKDIIKDPSSVEGEISKRQKVEENAEENIDSKDVVSLSNFIKSDVNVLHLPIDVWEYVLGFISDQDIVTLSSVCKKFQWIVQALVKKLNLSGNYRMNTDYLLNYALSTTCSSININHCYWFEPSEILELISRTELKHLHLIECNINEDIIKSICDLDLKSLSITYSKEWRSYIQEHSQESLNFFQKLINLELLFHQSLRSQLEHLNPKSIFYDIFINILQHCKELQHLKVVDSSETEQDFYEAEPSEFLPLSTPMPKLKSLVVDVNYEACRSDVINFLEVIIQDKTIPLEYTDFGHLTCYLNDAGVFNHLLVLPDKETLLLRGEKETYYFMSDYVNGESQVWQSTYKKIHFQNMVLENLDDCALKMMVGCREVIKEIRLRDCSLDDRGLFGIAALAVICPQITVLELTVCDWLTSDPTLQLESYCDYSGIAKNENLLFILTYFKNLEELRITPFMLHCDYYTPDDHHKCLKIMPFWKVTQACTRLRELHITNLNFSYCDSYLHMDSLYDIAHCQNLRVLHLIGFHVRGTTKFLLSRITKSCTQLRELGMKLLNSAPIVDQEGHELNDQNMFLDSLSFAKNLKSLSINLLYNCCHLLTKSFTDSLCLCENLEKMDIFVYYQKKIEVRYLIDSLPKLKNLFVFFINFGRNEKFTEDFNLAFQKIKNEKPTFYGSINECRAFTRLNYFGSHLFSSEC